MSVEHHLTPCPAPLRQGPTSPRRLAALAAAFCALTAVSAQAAPAYVLTSNNQLIAFDTSAPGASLPPIAITGLAAGDSVVAIDFRPATGQLYALGSGSRIYVINPLTGAARQVGAAPFTPALAGSTFGFDFNPTVDRIRVVSDTGQNFRLHPDTGALAGTDTSIDDARDLAGSAYTNNYAGAALTTLYALDVAADELVRQGGADGTPSPNTGTITTIGPLGVAADLLAGFDVTANDNLAFAALTVAGTPGLYQVDLTSGAATLVGSLPAVPVRGLAVLSRTVTLYGVTPTNQLVRFNSATPGTILATTAITGLQAGESVLGIDVRPSTGELYALGSTSRLYRLEAATGAATPVSTTPFAPALAGTEFGFDFNPVADRIRVTSNTSQNLRLHPDTGAVAGADTNLTELGNPDISSASAYTNPVDGAIQTSLYNIDATSDRLGLQGSIGGSPTSPNAGTVTDVGALGVDATDVAGFDISPLDNRGLAALTVAGTPGLYAIDLQTGAATLIGAIGGATPLRALAAKPAVFNLSEGATGVFFDTDVLLMNPTATPTPATITYLRQDGQTITQGVAVPSFSRVTVTADTTPGVEDAAFSSTVTSPLGLPIVVERTMRWDPTGYGSHTEKAADALARRWFFAEGAQGFFQTYLLLSNPNDTANTATVEFLVEGGPTLTRTYNLLPQSRTTIYAGEIPELIDQAFGTTVTFARAGAAERAMYFGSPLYNGGHESAGVTRPQTTWFLAEGATGPFFTTFLLLANPGDTAANVTLNYFREGGGTVTRTRTINPRTRETINIAAEDQSLLTTSVATQVTSDQPIVAERAQYWPFLPAQWYEAHNSFGLPATATKWGLAEGRTGGSEGYQTFILLANPGSTPATATLTFMRTTGTPLTKTFQVPANARVTVPTGPGTGVPELTNEQFGTLVTSDQPIFVERAMYSSANGVVWAAGSNATATPVP